MTHSPADNLSEESKAYCLTQGLCKPQHSPFFVSMLNPMKKKDPFALISLIIYLLICAGFIYMVATDGRY